MLSRNLHPVFRAIRKGYRIGNSVIIPVYQGEGEVTFEVGKEMRTKKRKQRVEEKPIKQEIQIQDDPYWKISGIYMDAHRVGRFLSIFEQFEDRHPEWTGDLLGGMPTYYCILGVARGATKQDIEDAYEKKSRFSRYPDETIEAAFHALSNPALAKEYDELLSIFEQITKCMQPKEKKELINMHNRIVGVEKEYVRMGRILSNYKGYHTLYMHGLPDLYEIAGLAKDSTSEEIKKHCETEFLKKICTILSDAVSREDHDFLIYFVNKYADEKQLENREKLRKKWEYIDRNVLEKIVLAVLGDPDVIKKYMQRRDEILNSNQDWKQYLPPNRETFLSLLGIEMKSLSGDKKEVESTIREKYRYLEKTAKVNLAYSVLKNVSQREDYLWLLENHEMLNALVNLFSDDEKVPEELKKQDAQIIYRTTNT